MLLMVHTDHRLCLGCLRVIQPSEMSRISALSTLYERYPLCLRCKTKESRAINHMVYNYAPAEVTIYQKLMVEGYRKRWLEGQLMVNKEDADLSAFMDRFAAHYPYTEVARTLH